MRVLGVSNSYSFKGIKVNKKTEGNNGNVTPPSNTNVRVAQAQVISSWQTSLDNLKEIDTQLKKRLNQDIITDEEIDKAKERDEIRTSEDIESLGKVYGQLVEANKITELRKGIVDKMLQVSYDSLEQIRLLDEASAGDKGVSASSSGQKGVKNVAGYDYEMQVLHQEFIDKVAQEKQGKDVDIVGSILFFGPNGNGKTHITQSVAEATECNILSIAHKRKQNSQQIMQDIYKIAEKSEEQFKKDRTRTILFIDEADKIFDKKSPISKEFEEFIKTCSEKYHCSVFAATNYPNNIGVDMKDEKVFPIKMSIEPPEGKNLVAILKYALAGYRSEKIDYKPLQEEVKNRNAQTGGKINNGQIIAMCDDIWVTKNGEPITQKDIVQYVQSITPEIPQRRNEQFEADKRLLLEA